MCRKLFITLPFFFSFKKQVLSHEQNRNIEQVDYFKLLKGIPESE